MMTQKGQVVIILLLVVVVSLGVSLAIVGRSINEISTATKTEQSSRAFSAAEAGIEKAMTQSDPTGTVSIPFTDNQSSATTSWNATIPVSTNALEYPPFGKESFAQFWLADPILTTTAGSLLVPTAVYSKSSFNLYFGKVGYDYAAKPDDYPAVEVSVIYFNNPNYQVYRAYFDANSTRATSHDFSTCDLNPAAIATNDGTTTSTFLCKATVSGYLSVWPVLVRIRLLYSNISHPVALQPVSGGVLPAQATIYKSTGVAGNTQRTLQVFKQKTVLPLFLDFALFSANALQK